MDCHGHMNTTYTSIYYDYDDYYDDSYLIDDDDTFDIVVFLSVIILSVGISCRTTFKNCPIRAPPIYNLYYIINIKSTPVSC